MTWKHVYPHTGAAQDKAAGVPLCWRLVPQRGAAPPAQPDCQTRLSRMGEDLIHAELEFELFLTNKKYDVLWGRVDAH